MHYAVFTKAASWSCGTKRLTNHRVQNRCCKQPKSLSNVTNSLTAPWRTSLWPASMSKDLRKRPHHIMKSISYRIHSYSSFLRGLHRNHWALEGVISPSSGLALFSTSASRSSSSSGVPSLHAHASTYLRVSLFQILFMNSKRIGTRAIITTGKAGAPLVNVITKIKIVMMIWVAV